MGKIATHILFLCLLCSVGLHAQKSVYPEKINANNAVITDIADLSVCFDSAGNAMFDDLYIIGRKWQEQQQINYLQMPGLNLQQLSNQPNVQGIDINCVRQSPTQANLLWYVEPQLRCSVEIRQTFHSTRYTPATDQFGNITCLSATTDSVITDSTRYAYLPFNDPLPDSVAHIVARADTCSCRWTTAQGVTIHDYYDLDYISTTYHYVGTPDTVSDTVGCIVMRINHQIFNPRHEDIDQIPVGELKYVDGASEWISPTDTAFIPHAPGGGTRIARMLWSPDTVCDTFYWQTNIPRDTIYTLLRFSPTNDPKDLTFARNAISKYNIDNQTQQTLTHADALHYIRTNSTYSLESRWDAKQHGVQPLNISGKKIYFTGRLVPATILGHNNRGESQKSTFSGAVSGNNDGPAFIVVNNRGKNDLYLDNFQLGTQSLTVQGDEPTSMFDKVPRKYISAAITLQGNGQDTYIHFRGKNYLSGSSGKSTISTLYSAAVYMNVNSTDYISLTFDDLWTNNRHTAGLLKMEGGSDPEFGNTQSTYHCSASPIYSGNSHTSVTFNGGSYHLAPADNTTSNVNFMIISRRNYKSPLVNYTFPDVGSDVGDGLVYIKDGNFRMSTPLLSNPRNNPMMLPDGTSFDRENYIMYMPLRTYITGGNFENCLVRTTDGDAGAPDCTGLISCPTNGTDTVFPFYLPCDTANRTTIVNLSAIDPDAQPENYPFSNLQPLNDTLNNELYIMPYLPSRGKQHCSDNDDGQTQNWDVFFPHGLNPDLTTPDRPLLSTIKKQNGEQLRGTNYLAFIETNPHYPTENNNTTSNLTEPSEYHINRQVYLITWTAANRWIVKSMPFDVTDVNLIYTWATDNEGITTDPDLEWDYYKKVVQTMTLKGRWSELEKEHGLNMPFWALYRRAVISHKPSEHSLAQQTSTYFPQVARQARQLFYYGQTDSIQPSFYLLEAKDEPMADGSLCRSWIVPTPDTNGVIMHQGRTYAMRFIADSTNQLPPNFWNGKYIVLEGPEQTLNNNQKTASSLDDNSMIISGNATFNATHTLPDRRYDWNFEKQSFERCHYTSVAWAEAYIVAGNDAWVNNHEFDMQPVNIQCIDTLHDAVDEIPVLPSYLLNQDGNHLTITTFVATSLSIYAANGQMIKEFTTQQNHSYSLNLQSGVYCIVDLTDGRARKIIIY